MLKHFATFLFLVQCLRLIGANLIPGDSSFETGFGVWNERGEIVSDTAFDGQKSLKLSDSVMTHAVFTLEPGQPYVMSCYLKAAEPDTVVHLQGYRTNWDGNYINKWVRPGTQWERFTLEIPAQEIGGHNKFWLLVKPEKQRSIWLDAVQLEKGSKPESYHAAEAVSISSQVLSPVTGNIFHPGEQVKISFQVYNSKETPETRNFQLRISDYYHNELEVKSETITLAAKSTWHWEYQLPKQERLGFFLYQYQLGSKSGDMQQHEGSFCIVMPPLPPAADGRSLFGMSAGPSDRLPALARVGVKAASVAFRWSYYTEKQELAPHLLQDLDDRVDLSLRLGIEPILYLRRTPRWATMKQHPHDVFPPREEMIPLYEDFAYKVASHFKGRVRNYQLWGGEADLLANSVKNVLEKDEEWFSTLVAQLHQYGYKGIKRADPSAVVAVTGVSGVDCSKAKFPFLRQVLEKARGFYDEATVHPYCYPSTFSGDNYVQAPEDNHLPEIYQTASRLAGGLPVGNGEFGFAIDRQETLNSAASRRMSDYMLRSFLLTASVPQATRIMWYTVAGNYDSYSIWRWPHPRPMVAAYANLAQLLTNTDKPEELSVGSLVRGLLLRRQSGSLAALWCPSNREVELSLPAAAEIRLIDCMGNSADKNKPILLSGTPYFLVSDKGPEQLLADIKQSSLLVQAVDLELRLQSQERIQIQLSNQLNKELSGKIQINLPGTAEGTLPVQQEFSRLRPGVTEKIPLELANPLSLRHLNQGASISALVTTAEGDLTFEQKVKVLPCYHVDQNASIDGDLTEWDSHPFIELNSSRYLYPPDAASHSLWMNPADLSIRAWTGWNEQYFYFAARVYDDKHCNANEVMKIWAGDCIQIAFDTLNNALGVGYDSDDRELSFGYSSSAKAPLLSQTWPLPQRIPDGCLLACKVNEGSIDYELAIPFALLQPLKALPGSIFAFNFVATDQDVNRIDYWMGLTYGICGGKDPSKFEKFVLMPPGSKKEAIQP